MLAKIICVFYNYFILVGIMAFLFKIAQDANPSFLPHDWMFAVEFAGNI